jgi:biopolymer transport protein ExbD
LKLQHHIKEDPNLDLTSLIDVIFLLLIFFMVSTTFEKQALLKVDLPEASVVEDRTEMPDSLELVIDAEGRMFLNDQRLIDSEPRTIRAAIEQAAGAQRDLPLILRADRETPHHFVVTSMDVAAQMGFINLSIATDRTDGFPE